MKSKYKLCYATGESEGFLYFTDNFEYQWGDDWGDAPYEHNAGSPYEFEENEYPVDEYGVRIFPYGYNRGFIKVVAYYIPDNTKNGKYPNLITPCFRTSNSSYSVENINKGAVAWLYDDTSKTSLMAGTPMTSAIKWLRNIGCKCAELK